MDLPPLPNTWILPFRPHLNARDKLDHWVSIERAVPGRMHLLPLFGSTKEIIDFRCTLASAAAARLLNESSGYLVGTHLGTWLASQENGHDVLAGYVSVIKTGKPLCVTSMSRRGEELQHWLRLTSLGVLECELRDPSAIEHARASFSELKASPPER